MPIRVLGVLLPTFDCGSTDLKITPSGQTIVKPTALGPVANTDTKLLIYGLFQKGRVLAQDGQPQAAMAFLEIENIAEFLKRRDLQLQRNDLWKYPPAGLNGST